MNKLADQVVIVTGASAGIGKALCLALAPQRPKLVLAARNEQRLNEVAQQCEAMGAEALIVPTDVTQPKDCRRLVDQAIERFGRLDVLINNAGAAMWVRFDEVSDLAVLERIMQVNYFGSVYCTYWALPHLKQSRGRIVALASVAGLTGVPLLTGYVASKHAVFGFFESLRMELRSSGVSITIIAPDFTQSEIFRRALGGAGDSLGSSPLDERKLTRAEDIVPKIIRAIERRQRTLLISARGKSLRIGKALFPRLVDWVTSREMRNQ